MLRSPPPPRPRLRVRVSTEGGSGQVAHNQGRPDPEPQGALKNVIQVNVMIRFLRKKNNTLHHKVQAGSKATKRPQ